MFLEHTKRICFHWKPVETSIRISLQELLQPINTNYLFFRILQVEKTLRTQLSIIKILNILLNIVINNLQSIHNSMTAKFSLMSLT